MDKQMGMTGVVVLVAVLIILVAGLIPTMAGYIGTMTSSSSVTNQSITLGAVDTWVDLTGQNLLNTATANNYTHSGDAVNVTFREAVSSSTGTLRVQVKANNATWANKKINVTYNYGPEGYVNDAGGRAVAGVILVFVCVALLIASLSPTVRSGFLDMIGY